MSFVLGRQRALLCQISRCCQMRVNQLSQRASDDQSYDLVVVGGGSGGCSIAAKFCGKMKVAVVDPADVHYYQPMWTLVGGGMKKLGDSGRPMSKVLPKKATWIKDHCVGFTPEENSITTKNGTKLRYNLLVVAMGLQTNYHLIPGLEEALATPNSGVCSNYSPRYVDLTFSALKRFEGGQALFTYPNSPVKCAGAPQKIMYIAEEYLRKNGKRENAEIIYNTALPVLFGIKKYAESLWKIVEERNIKVNVRRNLAEVKASSNEAVFEHLDDPGKTTVMKYSLLHATPPMSTPDVLRESTLVDANGFLSVSPQTLRHNTFDNILGVGDCLNTPNAKTAAAVAAQLGVLQTNISKILKGQEPTATYSGYASCPLVTGYSKCILAEFDYTGTPRETFPLDQGKESRSMFHMKKDFMPPMYWHGFLRGYWNGPEFMRKIFHPFG